MARTVFSNGIAFTSRNANTGGGGGDARPFIAYYGRTTFNEIHTADSEGQLVLLLKDGVYYPLVEIAVSTARFYGRSGQTSEGVQFSNITINSSNTWATAVDIVVPKAILAAIAISGSYNDLHDIPAFARVAMTGSYADLINQPVITSGSIIIDTALSENSTNPVQNKVITRELAKQDGYYETLSAGFADKAGDLDIASAAMTSHTQIKKIETTGGDESVKDGNGYLRSFSPVEGGKISASGAKVVSVGFNLIPSGSGTTFTFPCVKGEWGAYGSAKKNNGYLFTNSQGQLLTVTSVKQNGVAVPTHTENGKTYYLPSADGEMTVVFASSQTNPCCHLCWSNYRDNDYESYNASEISLASAITAMGGTMRRIGYVADTIVTGDKWYRRVGRNTLGALSWTMTPGESTEGGTAANTFRAIVSGGIATSDAIKSSGLYSLDIADSNTLDGTTLVVSSEIESVEDFVDEYGSKEILFELETEVTGTTGVPSTGEITISDFGIIRFVNSAGDTPEMAFDLNVAWADYIKNLPGSRDTDNSVVAEALANLNARLSAIENMVADGFPKLKIDDLTVARSLFLKVALGDAYSEGAGAPTSIPAGVLMFYRNTTDDSVYMSVGSESSSNWLKIK